MKDCAELLQDALKISLRNRRLTFNDYPLRVDSGRQPSLPFLKMSDYQASWQRTERLLATAKTLLLPEVAAANEADLRQFDEFLNANELELAFEWLESITYEDQPTCLPLLRLLRSAAEEMNLRENLAELDNRIYTLENPFTQ